MFCKLLQSILARRFWNTNEVPFAPPGDNSFAVVLTCFKFFCDVFDPSISLRSCSSPRSNACNGCPVAEVVTLRRSSPLNTIASCAEVLKLSLLIYRTHFYGVGCGDRLLDFAISVFRPTSWIRAPSSIHVPWDYMQVYSHNHFMANSYSLPCTFMRSSLTPLHRHLKGWRVSNPKSLVLEILRSSSQLIRAPWLTVTYAPGKETILSDRFDISHHSAFPSMQLYFTFLLSTNKSSSILIESVEANVTQKTQN